MINRDATNSETRKKAPRIEEFSARNDRASRRFGTNENTGTDDVIGSLANAYENERARQVTEWEIIGRLTFRQAA